MADLPPKDRKNGCSGDIACQNASRACACAQTERSEQDLEREAVRQTLKEVAKNPLSVEFANKLAECGALEAWTVGFEERLKRREYREEEKRCGIRCQRGLSLREDRQEKKEKRLG